MDKCPECGDDGTIHVCLPVVIQMLMDSNEFQEMVKSSVDLEIMKKTADIEQAIVDIETFMMRSFNTGLDGTQASFYIPSEAIRKIRDRVQERLNPDPTAGPASRPSRPV